MAFQTLGELLENRGLSGGQFKGWDAAAARSFCPAGAVFKLPGWLGQLGLRIVELDNSRPIEFSQGRQAGVRRFQKLAVIARGPDALQDFDDPPRYRREPPPSAVRNRSPDRERRPCV